MSNELFAFIDQVKVPTREAWQQAIHQSGFDLQLDPGMKAVGDSRFSPCTLMGTMSGVEISGVGEVSFLNDFSEIHNGRDFCITFRWGGDMRECACALVASYVLARDFGAIVSFEGNEAMPLEELLQEARDAVDSVRKKH
jgi:hypothetical protein